MKGNDKLTEQRISLASFIKDNEALLSALGAFVALVLFSQGIKPNFLAAILSFTFIAGLVLIAVEIWFRLPSERDMTGRLFLFRYVLYWSIAGVIFYWLLEYRIFWDMFLYFPVIALAIFMQITTVVPIIRRFEITRRFFGIGIKKTGYRKFLLILGWIFVVTEGIIVGANVSFATNVVLDIIKQFAK